MRYNGSVSAFSPDETALICTAATIRANRNSIYSEIVIIKMIFTYSSIYIIILDVEDLSCDDSFIFSHKSITNW